MPRCIMSKKLTIKINISIVLCKLGKYQNSINYDWNCKRIFNLMKESIGVKRKILLKWNMNVKHKMEKHPIISAIATYTNRLKKQKTWDTEE